jgi:hypothetical protein
MREPVDAERIREFARALGREARGADVRVYLAGGSSAVLKGWRPTTVDVDLKIVPDTDPLMRALAALKEALRLNVEIASPGDFIPELPGWQDRSPFITREGTVSFHHYDFYAQALAKIERGHRQDLEDARRMVEDNLVDTERLRRLFADIEPLLYRFPAIDPTAFRRAVEAFCHDEK